MLFLASCKPYLVLLDLMLPGLSVEEVLPQIAGIPVIVDSAKVDVNDKVDLLLSGAVDYVTKPFARSNIYLCNHERPSKGLQGGIKYVSVYSR